MIRVMVFIDGSWFYRNRERLREQFQDPEFQIDYGKLPGLIQSILAERLGTDQVRVIRTYLCASVPRNVAVADQGLVDRQERFFEMLATEHFYDVTTFPIDFRGYHLRSRDRVAGNEDERAWFPAEKMVDVALASRMLTLALSSDAYEIAVLVCGDVDYKPALQAVRDAGKQVMIVGIAGSTSQEFLRPTRESRVCDFETVLLNDYPNEIRLEFQERTVPCESCGRLFTTHYRPRRGERLYCDACRSAHHARLVPAAEGKIGERLPHPGGWDAEMIRLESEIESAESVFASWPARRLQAQIGQWASQARVVQDQDLGREETIRLRRVFGRLSTLSRRFQPGYVSALDRSKVEDWIAEQRRWTEILAELGIPIRPILVGAPSAPAGAAEAAMGEPGEPTVPFQPAEEEEGETPAADAEHKEEETAEAADDEDDNRGNVADE